MVNDMNKKEKIESLFKILATHDDVIKNIITTSQWKNNIISCLLDFISLDIKTNMDNIVIRRLKGMKEIYNELNHNEIRTIILGLTNDIKKEV